MLATQLLLGVYEQTSELRPVGVCVWRSAVASLHSTRLHNSCVARADGLMGRLRTALRITALNRD
jgi:hypothetical protein